MQNLIPKFRQSSIISNKLGYLSEKLKTLMSSNYHRVKYFLLKLWTNFYIIIPTRGCLGLIKMVSVSMKKPDLFLFLQITQDSNKIRKTPKHPFVDNGK